MTKTLVIFGSARSDGEAMQAVLNVIGDNDAEIIDLVNHDVTPFDYEHKNEGDDFVKIAQKMVEAETIIFASPVYWYSMSAQLKIFFDRFTDLITIRKELGRELKGKKCYVISCGSAHNLPTSFEEPFSETCKYLDMDYKGCFYHYNGKEVEEKEKAPEAAKQFGEKIFG